MGLLWSIESNQLEFVQKFWKSWTYFIPDTLSAFNTLLKY